MPMRVGIIPGKIEFIFHTFVCILMMGAFFPMFRSLLGIHSQALEGDPFQRAVLTTAYALALLSLCFQLREVLLMIASTPVLWLLMLWATLSILWSDFPDVAFRRVLALWLTSLYGLVLCLRFEFKSLLRLLGGALLVVLAASLALVILFPDWAVMGPPLLGNWRGVFIHKNHLGRFSALALLVAGVLFLLSEKTVERIFWGVAITVALVTLLGSQSLSALAVSSGMILSVLFLKTVLRRKKLVWLWLLLFMIVAAVAVFLLAQNYERVMVEGLDKDASLSGRLPLWRSLFEKIASEPLLGYGYGTFWLGADGPAADIWKKLNWEVPHAHNGYLDLWLHLGLPGVCLGLYLLLQLFVLSIKNLFSAMPAAWFWVLLLLYLISYNLVESIFLSVNSLFMVLIVYSCVVLQRRRSAPVLDSAGTETCCRSE